MHLLNDVELLSFTGMQESQFLVKPSELLDKIKARLSHDGSVKGDLLPWSKSHNLVRLRPGEVSIWAGISGHGKSQMLGQVAAFNLQYKKWLIASMEMLPDATMERMDRNTKQMVLCRWRYSLTPLKYQYRMHHSNCVGRTQLKTLTGNRWSH